MIGGGKDSFIGAIHRLAANMDGNIELSCGALSIDVTVAIESGKSLFLPEDRIYTDYSEMISVESKKPKNERIDFVTIVTPNFAHFAPAMLALEHGFHVVIEKPIAITLDEAQRLQKKVEETGLLLCLMHTYSGYPMVKQAKSMVRDGALGKIRKVVVQYPQGWLSSLRELEGNVQAAWRTDPAKSGKSGCMGDIGTHAAHLAEYITGLKISQICADLNTVVEGRRLDDDGNLLLRFSNGANGVLIASQIAAGEENALQINIYGEKGGLEWKQAEPNSLWLKMLDAPVSLYRAGSSYLCEEAKLNSRTPAGHPEGYIEAFANIYSNFVNAVLAVASSSAKEEINMDFPNVSDGVRGMKFIETVITSNQSSQKWTEFAS